MRIMTEKGLAFSLDLLCSFIGMCMISIVSIQFLNSSIGANSNQLREFELEKNAIMLFDAMVKNHNEENPALGAAIFNKEKHRVEENNLDSALLKRINPLVTKNVFLRKLEIVFKDGARQMVIDYAGGTRCLGVSRLVLVGGRKALLEGVVCLE